MEVEGDWSAPEEESFTTQGWDIPRYLSGREGSISVGIVGKSCVSSNISEGKMVLTFGQGDALQMNWVSFSNETVEGDEEPSVINTINGSEVGVSEENLVPLDPGGWYNVGLHAPFVNTSPTQSLIIYDIIYHPVDNITHIRDIIPEALVESFSSSPPQSNELGCAARDSGAASHLRETTGALLLLPMIFIWYALR